MLPIAHRSLDVHYLGPMMKRRIVANARSSLKPSEAANIYHSYCGFETSRKTTEADLAAETEAKFKRVIRNHQKFTGKPRFLTKQTANTQRIRVIHRMFPDAYCIHIIRDGRAVANSLLNTKWWNDIDIWWLGQKPARWKATGKEPIELCALHWKREVEEIHLNKHLFENRYLEVRYEDLTTDPRAAVGEVVRFCRLGEFPGLSDLLPETMSSMNYKWERALDKPQKEILMRVVSDQLAQLGYSL